MTESSKLTAKQQRFVDEYLTDLNATAAAIRAGYSEKTANQQGPRLLVNVGVAAAIAKAMEERSERVQADADWVLQQAVEVVKLDIADIMDDVGAIKPVKEWPSAWRKMLAGADVQHLYEGSGRNRKRVGEIVKLRFLDRLKALEMVGRHVNVQAFKDKVEVDPGDKWQDLLDAVTNSPLGSPQARLKHRSKSPEEGEQA